LPFPITAITRDDGRSRRFFLPPFPPFLRVSKVLGLLFCFPMTAMSRDDGDLGDSSLLRLLRPSVFHSFLVLLFNLDSLAILAFLAISSQSAFISGKVLVFALECIDFLKRPWRFSCQAMSSPLQA
jgi:hypothetical protein